MSTRTRLSLLVPLAKLAVVVSCCVIVYRGYTSHLPPLSADETGHALPGARMAFHLAHGRLTEFFADTEREMLWPFVHPWYLAFFFVGFGISTAVARLSSLVAFGGAVLLSSALARELLRTRGAGEEKPPVLAGVPTALLMLLNSDFWAQSSQVMLEPLGMALTSATLLTQLVCFRRASTRLSIAAGLLAGLTFLTKYNYGLPLIAALLVSVMGRGAEPRRSPFPFALAVFGPIAAWLFYPFPGKLIGFYNFALNRDEGLGLLDSLLFYPRAIAATSSWPVALWLFAAPVLSLLRFRERRDRLVATFVVLDLAMIIAHPNKQERYASTVLPILYALGEREIGRLFALGAAGGRRLGALVANSLMIGLSLAQRPWDPLLEGARDAGHRREGYAVMDYVTDRLRAARGTLVLGSTGMLPHLLVQWALTERYGVIDPVVDMLGFPGENGWDARYRSGYPKEMTPDYWPRLEDALKSGRYDRVVVFDFREDSAFNPDWLQRWDGWGRNYPRLMATQGIYSLAEEREFEESGVRVRLYEGQRSARTGSEPLR